MSQFNLDRFRFERNSTNKKECGSKSPESEKENKPAKVRPFMASIKPQLVFDEVEEENPSEPTTKATSRNKSKSHVVKTSNIMSSYSDDESELDDKMCRLLEIFPQLTRTQLLEVIGSTETLDGAVAACILRFGDNGAPDESKKRKQDESSSSPESSEIQRNKRRKSSAVSDEENEQKEPSREKQEAMVRKLQKRFPDQDKEELRSVLQQHDWNAEEALQVLEMFSDTDNTSFDSTHVEEKENHDDGRKSTKEAEAEDLGIVSETSVEDTVSTDDSENESEDEELENNKSSSVKAGNSSLSAWIIPKTSLASSSSSKPEISSSKPTSSSAASPSFPRFTSETGLAKQQAADRKRNARAADEVISSGSESGGDEEEEEELASSDFEDSDDDFGDEDVMTDAKKEILDFFQKASIDELSLISGCSIKKAKKIVQLRPFDTWSSLWDVFHKGNGLSEDLVAGCRVVLKERKIVQGLMSKCEKISNKMVKQVTEVMDNGNSSIEAPSLLNDQLKLKPYQLIGLKWLLLLHEHKLSGILADEMGLGKTIQAIAFLAQLFENGIEGPHLIIVPSSTLDNWVRELKQWCPSLKVLIYCGTGEERCYLKHDILNKAVDFNVIVTTYNMAIGNEGDRSLFRKLRLAYAIFDEGHMLKNMNALRYRHLMSINAKHRLLLTGTPLQNNLLELMSLLNFIMPSMFSSTTTQLSKMFSMKSHEEQSRFEKDRISQAKLIMKPFILRRIKSEVLQQLPAKVEQITFCSMSEKQRDLYQNLLKKLKAAKNAEKRELCNAIMQLRKMANHPLLHRQYYTTEKLKTMSRLMLKEPTHFDANPALIQEDMAVMSDFDLHLLCRRYSSISSFQLSNDLLLDSGKFQHLTQLLDLLKSEGHRVVLFSQFTMMLDIVEVLLKHLNHRYVRLDGSTPIAERIVLIDEYNNDPEIFVFLLSTRAGGLGINLTSANVVILHDIDYNPYNDKQAEDRCHRVGQTKTVKVIKLISEGSIEDCILHLGHKKLKLEQDMTSAEQDEEGTLPEDMASLLKASLGL